jgi:hypothetical protein
LRYRFSKLEAIGLWFQWDIWLVYSGLAKIEPFAAGDCLLAVFDRAETAAHHERDIIRCRCVPGKEPQLGLDLKLLRRS